MMGRKLELENAMKTLIRVLVAMLAVGRVLAGEVERPFGDNVRTRGNLDHSRLRFQMEHKGSVAFIGGSITEMEGYRPMVCELLKKRFPETAFKFTAAGISSTCSTTGAFRLASDVFGDGPVDLLFVEFAVNDDQDAHHTRAQCIRGMEGIIRHARALNPNVDIVVTFFVNEGMLKTLQEGKTPLTVEAHEAVAEHYGVPTINLAKEVAEEISAGKLTWKQYGGVHPAPFGNAICARMIDELFERAWKSPPGVEAKMVAHAMPDAPLDSMNYERGRFIDPKEAKAEAGWTLGVPDWKNLAGSKRARFTSIPMLYATQPGAELTLTFEGTSVGAYVVAGPDAGMVETSVDGGPAVIIDLYHAFSKGLHYPRTVMLATVKKGQHMLTLRVGKDTNSAGHAVRVMKFVAN
jgi:lysophospholipase L1-like esterase